jgi:hypothetical protein
MNRLENIKIEKRDVHKRCSSVKIEKRYACQKIGKH